MYSKKFLEIEDMATEFTKEISEFMSKIHDKFNWYEGLFLQNNSNTLTEESMMEQLKTNLNSLNGLELDELNNVCKMFSDVNCSWSAHRMGRIVHKEIMKIFFGDLYL